MTHPKLMLNMMQLPTIHLQLPSSKYALTRSYEFGHYRSFWKVNKNTFFVKASYISMEYQISMRPKGLLRGHLKLSKKSKNTFIESKLKELCIGEVDLFCKIVKSQMCLKLQFLSNGPNLLCLSWVCNMVHDPWSFPLSFILIYLIYFDFYPLKIKLNQINHLRNKRFHYKSFYHQLAINKGWQDQSKSLKESKDWICSKNKQNQKLERKIFCHQSMGFSPNMLT